MEPEKGQQERRTAKEDRLGEESVIRDNQSAGERINVSFSWFGDIFHSVAVFDTSGVSFKFCILNTALKITNVLVY